MLALCKTLGMRCLVKILHEQLKKKYGSALNDARQGRLRSLHYIRSRDTLLPRRL